MLTQLQVKHLIKQIYQIKCKISPQNDIALDPYADYVITPQPIQKDPLLLLEITQIQTAISHNKLSTHSLVSIAPLLSRKFFKKTYLSCFCFWLCFFGVVIKTMMTAMIGLPDSKSDSDDSDTPSLSHHKTKNKTTKSHENKSNIKFKLLNPKNKNTLQK